MMYCSQSAKEFAVLSGIPASLVKLGHEAYSILSYDEVLPMEFIKVTEMVPSSPAQKQGSWKRLCPKTSLPATISSIQANFHCKSVTSSIYTVENMERLLSPPRECQLFSKGTFDDLHHVCNYNLCEKEPGVMQPCKHPSGPSSREYKSLLWGELKLSIRLLKQLVYKCPDGQAAAQSSLPIGIFEFIRRMWGFCLHDTILLHEVLGLLANLAAHSNQAKEAIASEDSHCSKGGPLMDRIVALVLRVPIDEVPTLRH